MRIIINNRKKEINLKSQKIALLIDLNKIERKTNRSAPWSQQDNPSERVNLKDDGSQTPEHIKSGRELIERTLELAEQTPEDQPYFEIKSM